MLPGGRQVRGKLQAVSQSGGQATQAQFAEPTLVGLSLCGSDRPGTTGSDILTVAVVNDLPWASGVQRHI